MYIKIDLHRPFELRAFATFCEECAKGEEKWREENPPAVFGLGGIDHSPNGNWQTIREVQAQADAEARQKGENVDGSERRETTEAEPTTTTFREFGKAPEGKTRRTKEEIAEDEELQALIDKGAFNADQAEVWVREKGHAAVIRRGNEWLDRKAEDAEHEAKSNISASPEDRQDPENPADAEQDAADEQAEVDAARDPEAPLTIDDLKSAMNEFVEAKGMPTTQKEGPGIFEKALGKPPAGEAAWKLSLLNDATQEQLSAAIAAWKEAANG